MNSIVIYFHPKKPSRHNIGKYDVLWSGDEIVGYVRAELHLNTDALHALDAAKPREKEIVLNSVEL